MNVNKQPDHIPLEETERLEIVARVLQGDQYCDIAKDFGVRSGTIDAARRKRKWFKDYKKQIIDAGYQHCLKEITKG